MRVKEIILIGISCTSLMCSIIALCHTLPRELGMDYLGVIISVLAFLTTLLLGWNIYTVVDFNNKSKKINELGDIIKNHNKYEQFISGFASNGIADIYGVLLDRRRIQGKEADYAGHRINAMIAYSKCDKLDDCNKINDDLIDFFQNGPGQMIDENTCHILFDILDNLKNKDSIRNYHQLCSLLLRKVEHKECR